MMAQLPEHRFDTGHRLLGGRICQAGGALQLVEEFLQGIEDTQKQRFEFPIDPHGVFFEEFEAIFEAMGDLLNAAKTEHGRSPFDGVGGAKHFVEHF